MYKNILEQLQLLKSENKFPDENWAERGLIPSPDDIREKMNNEVNNFIDFISNQFISNELPSRLTAKIKDYMNKWDSSDYDTEETEYIVDEMCKVMRMVGVDISKILI